MFETLTYLGILMALGGFFMFGKHLGDFIKMELTEKVNYKRLLWTYLGWMAVSSLGLGLMVLGLVMTSKPDLAVEPMLQASFGGTLFLFTFEWLLSTFMIYNRKKNLDRKYRPVVLYSLVFMILPVIVSLWVLTEGITPVLSFPLPKGIPFANPVVTFYAVFILGGAIFVYYLSELQLQSEGYRKGYAENVFYVAFPAGIVGSRIWYVIGQWETEFAGKPFWKVFAMWEGGLAIMGGALFGALAGILFIIFRRKDITLRHAADIGVPTILVAQGIGRWGNFFNQEVYGATANVADWSFLPSIIKEQMIVDGLFRIPLFLIESLINISGYLVIRFAIGKGLKKYILPGDLALIYPIWYGLTRVVMEPLRDQAFIMNNLWSYYWGMIFAILGVLGIVTLHVIDYLKKRKAKKSEPQV